MAKKKKVLIIGGGSGAPGLVRGFPSERNLRSVVIPMSDSGGGAAIVGGLFNLPAFSDLDRALIALAGSNISPEMAILMSHRLQDPVDGGLRGVRTSNLVTSIFANYYPDIQQASDAVGRLIRVPKGERVYPATLVSAELVAMLKNGTEVFGEHKIDDPYVVDGNQRVVDPTRIGNLITTITITPQVGANPEAISAIHRADIILIAPGSLYTSIIAGLVVPGIVEAITEASQNGTPVVLVANLMTEPYQTDHLSSASSQLAEVLLYLPCLTHLIVNNGEIPGNLLAKYKEEGQQVVECDYQDGWQLEGGVKTVARNLLGEELAQTTHGKQGRLSVLRHDPKTIELIVRDILGGA